MNKTTPAALEALLSNLIDYAGLFPPAKLDMADAVRTFAAHRLEPHAAALGRFVVPAARLNELVEAHQTQGIESPPWSLSVLTGDDLALARRRIDDFRAQHATIAAIDAIEMRADDAETIAQGAKLFGGVERFVEIPHQDDPLALMTALREHGSLAKIRTGGITADAFPSSLELARFLTAAARSGIALKATAGLHHPLCGRFRLTYETGSAHGRMFGFLTVFLAAAFARTGQLDTRELVPLLEAKSTEELAFDDEGARWRDQAIHRDQIVATRTHFARSYGSCSFREPIEDLQTLGLLP